MFNCRNSLNRRQVVKYQVHTYVKEKGHNTKVAVTILPRSIKVIRPFDGSISNFEQAPYSSYSTPRLMTGISDLVIYYVN